MKKWVVAAIALASVVIILGAYTRLADAGLGCPDWPGCYGHLVVPSEQGLIDKAEQAFPERALEADKAWIEMIHRYFASTLGLLVIVIVFKSFSNRRHHGPIKLPIFLLLLVCFQGALGMWTVTWKLYPPVVMAHLLGGFSVLSCLYLLSLRLSNFRIPGGDANIRSMAKFAALGVVLVLAQIALGGWTSSNYAALACTQMPVCEGNWVNKLDFAGAFSVPDADNYEFGAHTYAERMTMHITHRFGAIFVFVYLSWLAINLYRKAASSMLRSLATTMMLVLGVQVILGVSNVVFSLPILVAVAHNAVAAILLLVMVKLSYTLYRKT